MRNDSQRSGDGGALVPSGRGIIPNSFRTFTGCLKYVTSSAASVASTVRSAASAMVDRDGEINFDQVRILKILFLCYYVIHLNI